MLVTLTGYIDVDADTDTDHGDDDEEEEWDRRELSLLLKRSFALIWY